VRRIWGVGPVAEARLLSRGFRTMGDLARADADLIEQVLGGWGLGLARLARGEDLREIEPHARAVSYSEENTFGDDVSDRGVLEATILTHSESVARRLRHDHVRGRTVILKWRDARRRAPGPRGYPLHTRQTTLFEASDDGGAISRVARRLLAQCGPSEPIRLLGVGVSGLEDASTAQLSLFGRQALFGQQAVTGGPAKPDELNHALDEINHRFGRGSVVRASQGPAERAGLSTQIKRGESEDPPQRDRDSHASRSRSRDT
jgi:DNA polymerase-4